MSDFMELVKRMRAAQTGYFKTRNNSLLLESKRLERKVDEAIKREESGQPDLFETMEVNDG